ncbi:MAG: BON domain-containing protein [Methylibium sp.]|uniref:BON domain-containing protein n=1 Tax=Methylibium sp. TaxID=2067992 RepID=UPI00184AA355|nr:BON domain-containing protein [Methylibium sp.]MBA2723191.1 BON domain-containing protein [Methylibium sp.]MBA3589873.1 BON domain-containing protein [Methylibium sp.]MBA3624638.1 BON domain-containing protein [Methylibium sp.]
MKTDTQLQQDVLAELQWEPSVNAAKIGVKVVDGIVTLAGHVDRHAEKRSAEHAAQRVYGVKALATDIDVSLPGSSKRTDGDIARSVENALQWTTFLPKDSVKVTVEAGWVTLSGPLNWEYQRQSAASAVRYLLSVTGVSDQLVIKPKVAASAVKTDIEAAPKRHAHADAQKISVEVRGADVTLTGKLPTWAERDMARNAAWGTPGVCNVIDNITVGS